MKKLATTQFAIHPLLEERWSPRAFDTKEVSKEIIDSLLEALRWEALLALTNSRGVC